MTSNIIHLKLQTLAKPINQVNTRAVDYAEVYCLVDDEETHRAIRDAGYDKQRFVSFS